jgi:putative hemolysin
MVALEEEAGLEELRRTILEKHVSDVPLYKGDLDNITGILHTENILNGLLRHGTDEIDLCKMASDPIFVSEFSSLNYVLREFKRRGMNMAIIIDEYGTTLGHVTINDIFSEIFEELELQRPQVKQLGRNRYLIEGQTPVEEVNARLNIHLPERKDYATLSGLFVYHFGKFPESGASITVGDSRLEVKRMGERKIEEILLILPS